MTQGNAFRGTFIGFESLTALMLATILFAVFFAKFYLMYSYASGHINSISNETASAAAMQHLIYLAYYSNLSMPSFSSLLSVQPQQYSIVPFYDSSDLQPELGSRIVAIDGRLYIVAMR